MDDMSEGVYSGEGDDDDAALDDDDDDDLLDDADDDEFAYEEEDTLETASQEVRNKLREAASEALFAAVKHSELPALTKRLVKEISSVLEIGDPEATALLVKYGWDKEKVLEHSLEEEGDFSQKSGLSLRASKRSRVDPSVEIECAICMADVPHEESYALPLCNHAYCVDCWTYYLKTKIDEGPQSIKSTCPFPKCTSLCTADVWVKCLAQSHPEYLAKYQRFLLNSFVDLSDKRKWCPSPECPDFVQLTLKSTNKPVECTCGFQFCFACHDFNIGNHAPATCEDVEAWLKKASSESENMKWLEANAKKCPKCRSFIEKNGGCMHMTCKSCTHEFCWLCRGDWKGHSSCNKSAEVVAQERSAEAAKTELEHYLHYYHRYESHRVAMNIAGDQQKQAQARAEDLMDRFQVRHQDITFLKAAADQLHRNRNMLEYSYVFGYYLSNKRVRTAEKNLFEYLQDQLERQTDQLSDLYERDTQLMFDYATFAKWREGVINFTRVCKNFLDKFAEGVIDNSLTNPEGATMSEDERFYSSQLEQLGIMGFTDTAMTLPLLVKHDGNVEAVIAFLFQ